MRRLLKEAILELKRESGAEGVDRQLGFFADESALTGSVKIRCERRDFQWEK
jgi:hypothetical protein